MRPASGVQLGRRERGVVAIVAVLAFAVLALPGAAAAKTGGVELRPAAGVRPTSVGGAPGIGVGRTVADGVMLTDGVRLGASTLRGASPMGRLRFVADRRRVAPGSVTGARRAFGVELSGLRIALRHNGVGTQRQRLVSARAVRLVKQRFGVVVLIVGVEQLGPFGPVVLGLRAKSVRLSVSGPDPVARFATVASGVGTSRRHRRASGTDAGSR